MESYKKEDGLLLAVISINRKINLYDWMTTMDYIDRSQLSLHEINDGLSRFISTGLLRVKKNKLCLSPKAKRLCRGGFLIGCIDWQMKVTDRVSRTSYNETEIEYKEYISPEEYNRVIEKRRIELQKYLNEKINTERHRKFIEKCNERIQRREIRSEKFRTSKLVKPVIVAICFLSYCVLGLGFAFPFLGIGSFISKIMVPIAAVAGHTIINFFPLSLLDYGYPITLGKIPAFEKIMLIFLYPSHILLEILLKVVK